jgi:hypothetical protein
MDSIRAIDGAVGHRAGTARSTTTTGPATSDDYKRAVFNDLARGPNG